MLFVRRFHYEVEVAPHQAEAKHLNRARAYVPLSRERKTPDPLKFLENLIRFTAGSLEQLSWELAGVKRLALSSADVFPRTNT